MENGTRLQVGIDFGKNKVDLALLAPGGEPLEMHQAFVNSAIGYAQVQAMLLEYLQAYGFSGVDIAGEATSYYWLPFFQQLSQDPTLAAFDPQMVLLNAGWVRWYKKSFPSDHKSDACDPYYIAERLRTLPRKIWWQFDEHWLALRILTRLRFHLVKSLSREKNHYQLFLFLAHSAYTQAKPFSNPFGQTSQAILDDPELLVEFASLPDHELAACLDEISGHHLSDPFETAVRLKRALQNSFPVPETLALPLQSTLHHLSQVIQTLQTQIHQIEAQIESMVASDYPEVAWLRSIPGVGPVFASGIAAEIAGLERFETPQKWDKDRRCYRKRTLREVEDAVAKFAGLWWPQNSSGDFEATERPLSKHGNAYLRYYLIQAVDHMRLDIPSYSRYYTKKFREVTKHQHKRALVLTARKAVGLFVGLLHHQETYRPEEERTLSA